MKYSENADPLKARKAPEMILNVPITVRMIFTDLVMFYYCLCALPTAFRAWLEATLRGAQGNIRWNYPITSFSSIVIIPILKNQEFNFFFSASSGRAQKAGLADGVARGWDWVITVLFSFLSMRRERHAYWQALDGAAALSGLVMCMAV